MTHLPALALLALVSWVQADPGRELSTWAVLRGVPVAVALAVAETETGNVPPHKRDRTISRGNVGRMQINASTWCPTLGLSRAACVRSLQQRSANIRVGVAILSRFATKYAPDRTLTSAHRCNCGGSHSWVSHYNAGGSVQPGTRGHRYGVKVMQKVRRMMGARQW